MNRRDAVIETLFTEEAIAERVAALGKDVRDAGFGPEPIVIAILKGGFVFAADLIRSLHRAGLQPEVDFMSLSSYGASTESSGEIRVLRDSDADVAGRKVLIVDDILESGRTLLFARELMKSRGAVEVGVVVFLDKKGHRVVDLEAEFVGFDCPDRFVVGYGMDMAHGYRELPFIGYVTNAG
jgi:hypoxanthine phosphoribosyltransferase